MLPYSPAAAQLAAMSSRPPSAAAASVSDAASVAASSAAVAAQAAMLNWLPRLPLGMPPLPHLAHPLGFGVPSPFRGK